MAYIAERVFLEGGNKKLLALNNCEYVRKLNIGNDWNQLYIGILAAVQGNGVAQNRAVPWGMGICSDMSGVAKGSTKHWVGSYSTSSQLTYAANSGNPYYTFGPQFARKVGTAVTTANTGTIQFLMPITNLTTIQRKVPMWLEVTRNSTTVYGVQNYTCQGAGMSQDYSIEDMLSGMEQVGATPTIRGQAMALSTANTLNGTEADGMLNTISIYWGSEIFPLEIYGIAVYRVQ